MFTLAAIASDRGTDLLKVLLQIVLMPTGYIPLYWPSLPLCVQPQAVHACSRQSVSNSVRGDSVRSVKPVNVFQ